MAKKKKSSKKKSSSKSSYTPSYVPVAAPADIGPYVSTAVAPGPYASTAVAPAAYQAGTYDSQYGDQISNALNTVTNWKYDPMSDANYQALAKVYGVRGNIAAKNSLADAAALNGGYGTSYAVSAAQQARNQYNQELAALIPDLEANAFNKATTTLNALRDADDTAYGRFRDTEADKQWKYGQDYQAYRDTESDNQWKYGMDYNAYRDKEADSQWAYSQAYNRYQDALSQYQWALDYNNSLYAQKQAQKKSKGGGGGGRKSSGGGGYVSTGGGYTGGGGGVVAPTTKFREAGNNGGINTTNKYDTKDKKKGYYAGPQK